MIRAKISLILIVLLILSSRVLAKDHGIKGATWNIEEPDLLEVIESKLKSLETTGELEDHKQKIKQKILTSIKEPEPIKGIVRAAEDREYYFDPTLIVNEDILDHRGRVIVKAGSKVNPLEKMPYRQHLVFIDGNDNEQVEWYMNNYATSDTLHKLILIAGKPFELMEKHKIQVYYDQAGYVTSKLNIKFVPALAKQDGLRIKIAEININKK